MTAVLERAPARAGWLLVATTASGAVNYAYAVVLTHGLAPPQYAAFAAGQALIIVAAAVAGAGIPWLIARELARAPHDPDRHAVVVTFGLWAGLAAGIALAVPLAGAELVVGTARDAAVVALASVLLSTGSTVLGYLQGHGRMPAIARTAHRGNPGQGGSGRRSGVRHVAGRHRCAARLRRRRTGPAGAPAGPAAPAPAARRGEPTRPHCCAPPCTRPACR